jgi:hypothetical protein
MRVDLGFDGKGDKRWAELIDLDDLPRRVSYKVQEEVLGLFKQGELHNGVINTITYDLMLAHTITAWSFGDPPNGDPERVRDLPRSAYRILADHETGTIKPYVDDLDFMQESRRLVERLEAEEKARPPAEPADTSA